MHIIYSYISLVYFFNSDLGVLMSYSNPSRIQIDTLHSKKFFTKDSTQETLV